ncbi:cysteine-rich repeat secretory protein 38-like [Cryptomeria japonica]|uniref:cysteine-rich repeat secretory protein 38-like n=1 Tax=Cryptomeria japonica TaxID=3369 RepID=UPI0027D9EBCB|nr:cysteine-rich repeat secretory protein 38-like [Cryptomeria japonica]
MNFRWVICTYVAHTCDNSSTFSNGSTYSTNLNLVINDLFRNAPQSSGYNISSHGQNPNRVYGLLQCTGDISSVKCSNCVVEVNSSIHERCPNDIGGRIWLDDCFMRYHNTNFISTLDTSGFILSNPNTITGETFKSTTSSLLSNLSNKAYIPANMGFATGSANYSASGMSYGLVQCWRDISIQDCTSCLDTAKAIINNSSNQGAQVQFGSCKVRYETSTLFDSAQSPTPSPEGSTPNTSTPALPPANGTPPTTTKAEKASSWELELWVCKRCSHICTSYLLLSGSKCNLARGGRCLGDCSLSAECSNHSPKMNILHKTFRNNKNEKIVTSPPLQAGLLPRSSTFYAVPQSHQLAKKSPSSYATYS